MAKVDAVALAATDSAHTDNRAIEIDATDQPGLYRVDWPDAAFAAGVREVILTVKHTTIFTEDLRVNLTPVPANVESWNNTSVPAEHTAGYPIVTIKDGTGTGEINTNAGAIALVDLVTLTSTVTTYTGNTPQTGDAYAIVNSGTHGNAALKTLIDAVDNFVDTEVNALTTELAKVPKSDSNVTWNATALASIQSEANDALVAYDGLVAADLPTNFAALAITATGAVGINWGNVENQSTSVTLDATTIAVASSVSSLASNSITSTALASNAASEIATAVWAQATRTLTALDEDDTTLDIDAAIRAAVGLAAANLDTQIGTLATASALDAVDNFVDTEIGAIQTTLAALFTTALTESYRADGAAGTVAQYLCELSAHLGEMAITSTTKRLNRHDGTTQAMAFTLNDASTPTAITRST